MAELSTKIPAKFTFSQSSLQDYADCPRRFQLRYLNRLLYPAAESEPALENERHQQEGQYFHRLAQQYLLGIPAEKLARLANTPNLHRWWENFVNAKDLTGLRDLSGLYPEVTLSAPLGDFRLVAKIDYSEIIKPFWRSSQVAIISSLMLTYVAVLFNNYFIYGPWAAGGFGLTAPFPRTAWFPRLTDFGGTIPGFPRPRQP